jgi:DNA primase
VRTSRRDVDDVLLGIEPTHYVEQLTGLAVPRQRKVHCPFHDDHTPSLHVYEDARRGWFCFGCGRGGSIYDFAALLWGCDTRGAQFVALRDELLAALNVP